MRHYTTEDPVEILMPEHSLILFLTKSVSFWPCYNRRMQIVNFPTGYSQVGARGECPHCSFLAYFRPVTNGYLEKHAYSETICNGAQCESCKEYVLVVGERQPGSGIHEFSLIGVYPQGKPNDQVDPAVPLEIRADFSEALRCLWVKAYKATVAICRRAIQASAFALGALGEKLIDQIDDLAGKGIITQPLKEMAHEIRLTGNLGAHPDKDGLANVTERDATDMVEFAREYLHHVYVMPAKLEARRKRARDQ